MKNIINEKCDVFYYNKWPWEKIPTEDNLPAYVNTITGEKLWFNSNYHNHRLVGPATILPNGEVQYWLNGKYYGKDIDTWLKDHPTIN